MPKKEMVVGTRGFCSVAGCGVVPFHSSPMVGAGDGGGRLAAYPLNKLEVAPIELEAYTNVDGGGNVVLPLFFGNQGEGGDDVWGRSPL